LDEGGGQEVDSQSQQAEDGVPQQEEGLGRQLACHGDAVEHSTVAGAGEEGDGDRAGVPAGVQGGEDEEGETPDVRAVVTHGGISSGWVGW
jgi:hypothetical protein